MLTRIHSNHPKIPILPPPIDTHLQAPTHIRIAKDVSVQLYFQKKVRKKYDRPTPTYIHIRT